MSEPTGTPASDPGDADPVPEIRVGRRERARAKPVGRALGWRIRDTRYLYQSDWFDLRQDDLQLPSGAPARFTYVEHPGFVSVVPLTAEGQIVLIRSYRFTIDGWCWEVPAGGVGNKPGASAREVAMAELREETGYEVAGRLERVAGYHNAIGNSQTPAEVFLATGVRPAGAQRLDATEAIEVRPRPAREVFRMARSGDIQDGASALAILLCQARIEAELAGSGGGG